ncbi:MAG TPA: hypothetical protein PL033_00855 [Candidatus Brocadiia bacterium]|nr:hypothetical protein [Candidatus Brocadiia bacterium]
MATRCRNSAPFMAVVLLVLFFYHPLWTRGEDYVLTQGGPAGHAGDGEVFYVSMSAAREALREGVIRQWYPYSFCGTPLAANPEAATFHPLSLFFILIPTELWMRLFVLTHILIGASGSFLFCRRLGGNRIGGAFAGVTFALSGFFACHVAGGHVSHIVPVATAPWAFLLIDKILHESGQRMISLAAGGAIMALAMMASQPQYILYISMALMLYGVVFAVADGKAWRMKGFLYGMAVPGGTLAIAAILSSCQLLPELELSRYGNRVADSDWADMFSWSPRMFSVFFQPGLHPLNSSEPGAREGIERLFWEFDFAMGTGTLVLAMGGLLLKPRKTVPLACVGALGLLVALGGRTPIFRILCGLIPGFSLFRIHARALSLAVIALPSISGVGLTLLLESDRRNQRETWRFRMAAIAGACGVILAYLLTESSEGIASWHPDALGTDSAIRLSSFAGSRAIAAFISGATTCILVFIAAGDMESEKRRHGLIALCLIITVIELIAFRWGLVAVRRLPADRLPPELVEAAKGLEYGRVLIPPELIPESACWRNGLFNLAGGGLHPLGRPWTLVHDLFKTKPGNDPVSLASAIYFSKNMSPLAILAVKSAIGYQDNGNGVVTLRHFMIDDALGRVEVIPVARFAKHSEEALALMREPGFDCRNTVVIESAPAIIEDDKETMPDWDKARAKISYYKPELIRIECSTPGKAYLVLNEAFYPGWTARINGTATEVYRADYALQVVRIPAGESVVEFNFSSRSIRTGLIISSVAWALMIIILIAVLARHRCSVKSQSH